MNLTTKIFLTFIIPFSILLKTEIMKISNFLTIYLLCGAFYFFLKMRHEFSMFPLYLITKIQRRNFKLLTELKEMKNILKLKDKGHVIEELFALPAWYPILSVESVNGSTWEVVKKNLITFVEYIPTKEKLGLIAQQESARLIKEKTFIDSKLISKLTLKIFLKWLFSENNNNLIDEINKGVAEQIKDNHNVNDVNKNYEINNNFSDNKKYSCPITNKLNDDKIINYNKNEFYDENNFDRIKLNSPECPIGNKRENLIREDSELNNSIITNITETQPIKDDEFEFINKFLTEEFLDDMYFASLEYRKEIALKGKGCKLKKQYAVDTIVSILKQSKYKSLFNWEKPECYSFVMQPFIISPMINISDIAVILQNNIEKFNNKDSKEFSKYLEFCLFQEHPFPILERFDKETNTQYFIDMRTLKNHIEEKDGNILNFGIGVRGCLGRFYAKEFITNFFENIIYLNDLYNPKEGHLYSGRDNDDGKFSESIYQIKLLFSILKDEMMRNFKFSL